MDIKDILDSLGLNLRDPEVKRGAVEAIQAILSSRTPPPDLGGDGISGMPIPSEGIDVDIDPDLIQPSQKHGRPAGGDADIEIEDEEDILSQIKHNESEDELDNDGNSNGDDSSSDSSSNSSSNDSSDSDSAGGGSSSDEDGNNEGDTQESEDTNEVEASENEPTASSGESEDLEDSEEGELDSDDQTSAESEVSNEDEVNFDEDDSEESDGDNEESDEEDEFDFDDENKDETKEENSEDEEDFDDDEESEEEADDLEFDDEDLIDDELKNSYEDQEIKSKHEARKIKRERTLAAAKKALADAKTKNVAQALINELEKSIEALESLVEAAQKNLRDISDEEFNLMINRVFDAISAVGDKDLTFTTDAERELRAQEIKTDLESRETKQALSDEDIAAIRAETQAIKAREKETAVYKTPAASSFKGFREFLNSLYRAIALQVQTNEVQDDTWSAINRRYSGTGVLKQGQRKNDLPDKKIPVIDFYFDCSGSWGPADIEVGKRAVSTLVDMEENGQIKINIFYFSNHVFNDMDSARAEGGTNAWNDIVKNIIATNATNVIIMTDSDMEDRWSLEYPHPSALKYTVPGYVWYLWRYGDNAPRLPRDLKGRGGVQQFSFNRGDV